MNWISLPINKGNITKKSFDGFCSHFKLGVGDENVFDKKKSLENV